MIKKSKLLFYLLMNLLLSAGAYAQQLNTAQQAEVNNYIAQAEKALAQDDKNLATDRYSKAAHIYWVNGVNDKAIEYYEKVIPLQLERGNKGGAIKSCSSLMNIYLDTDNNEKALLYAQKALALSREIQNTERIIENLNNTAVILKELKRYKEALELLKENLALILQQKDNQKDLRTCYNEMAQNYTGLNDTQNAMLYYNYFKTFDKYMVSTEKLEMEKKQAVAVAQATASRLKLQLEQLEHARTRDSLSNAEKKAKDQQLEIDLLNQNKKISELELERQNAQINKARTEKYILFGILGFIFLIFILLYFQFRQKKKANLLLAKKNHQLEEQKEEISMKNLSLLTLNSTLEKQRAELADKNELLEKQKSELAKKNEQIRQSIVYASKIQEAILPSQKAIMQDFPNSFIFYRPRDIVSGDFYWYSEKEGKQIIAAVDCTGHSVPGAFMSMIGNTLLNEIVNEKNILHPAQILDKLHDGIVSTLNQGRENDPKDGMDITLCVIDKKNKELEISTANHSVFIISNNNLQEIEGDIFSIGDEMLLHKKSNFTNHTVFLDQETTIYLMSDGYQDQFGGENNTKFMKFNLKKTLLSIQNLSLKEQGEFMIHTFYSWKGERQQIDDVLLIGLKIECEEE